MAIIKYTASRPASACREFMGIPNRLGRFLDPDGSAEALGWHPPVDVAETKDDIVVTTELPGLNPEDVTVELENGTDRHT